MKRPTFILVGAAVVAGVCALGFGFMTRPTSEPRRSGESPPTEHSRATASEERTEPARDDLVQGEVATLDQPEHAQDTSEETVARWIADTQSADPQARAEAIASLGGAPKQQAVPALEHVLDRGDAQVDGHIALRSLHRIALQQGDEDGRVREVLRAAIYHGSSDEVAESAQAFIEDIEAALASGDSR